MLRGLSRRRVVVIVIVAAAVSVTALAVGGFYWVRDTFGDGPMSVPSCSWPLEVRGHPQAEQPGLVRCYLRALASRDVGGLHQVANGSNGPVQITGASFTHTADARSGLATATFSCNPIASDVCEVAIAFADGAHEDIEIDLANPNSGNSWRLDIGTPAS